MMLISSERGPIAEQRLAAGSGRSSRFGWRMRVQCALLATAALIAAAAGVGFGSWLNAAEPTISGGRKPSAVSAPDFIEVRNCRVKFINDRLLAAGRAGIVSVVVPKEGELVQEGAVIVKLDDRVAAAALAVARKEAETDVEIRYSQKARDVSEAEYLQAVEANKRTLNVFPEIEVKKLKLQWERGVLSVESQEHQYAVAQLKAEEAQAVLNSFHIKAPFTGRVRRILRDPGEAVRDEEPVLELYNTERVEVGGDVSVQYRHLIKPGTPVEVQIDVEGVEIPSNALVFNGVVTIVGQDVTVANKISITAEVENPDGHLLNGMQTRMKLKLTASEKGAVAGSAAATPSQTRRQN